VPKLTKVQVLVRWIKINAGRPLYQDAKEEADLDINIGEEDATHQMECGCAVLSHLGRATFKPS
jgi:hypothetical protein